MPSLLHPGTAHLGSQPPTWSLGQMNELTVVTHIIVRPERWWSEPFHQVMEESPEALRVIV